MQNINNNVLSILLYGSECWKMTQTMAKLLDRHLSNQMPQKDQKDILA
jgi:hypothetical protein